MIVSVKTPANVTQVRYGAARFQPNDDATLDVPDYVAKTICTLDGFTTEANITASASSLLNAGPAADNWESSYLLTAYGKPTTGQPDEMFAAAKALMAERGEPVVSAS